MTSSARVEPDVRADGPSRWRLQQGDPITEELTAMRLLGGGASYEAYLAFDQITYSPVVVKVLRPGLVADRSALRGLRREAQALAVVNHPVLMRGLRFQEDGERPHLVLEHVDGPRLSSLVRRYGPLTEQQYLPLGIDLAAALHYFGRIGWTHLDIKPSNVIMGAPARLIDLSVARTVEAAASLGNPIGTDAYMSPEQAAAGEVDRFGVPGTAADVWGLGATLFHAIAGHRPFPEGDLAHRDLAVRYPQTALDPAELPGRTPRPVVDLVSAMLSRTPADRPRPAEVSEVLQEMLAVQPAGKLVFKVR